MRQWKKRTAVLAVAGMMAVSSLTGCSGSMKNDDVVAKVGKTEIKLGVANFYARMQQANYETYFAGMMGTTGEDMWSQKAQDDKDYEETIKTGILESLENMYLIRQHANEYEVSLTEEDTKAIEKAAEIFLEDNALEDKEAVSGYKKYVEEYLKLETLRQKMDAPMKAGVNEEVSDEEAAQKSMKYVYFAYTGKDAEGKAKELSADEKAALKEQAGTFAENLKNSETKDIDAAAAAAGLEVKTATFDAESTSPDAGLIKAVDALQTEGETTDVIESDYGLYVGKLTSLLDGEATKAEKKSIVEERKQAQYDSLIKKWREETEIEENEKVWKKVDFKKLGVTIVNSADKYDSVGE